MLAPYYDQIYGFVDYEQQAKLFDGMFRRFSHLSGPKTLLDLCCGTGTHMLHLSKLGYKPTGLDISTEMLEVARRKLPTVSLIQGDIRSLKVEGKFGFALCWFNSILYSQPADNFRRTLLAISGMLEPGGSFIFDVVDRRIGLHGKEREYVSEGDRAKIYFRPRWSYTPPSSVLDLWIRFRIEEDTNIREWSDHHVLCALSFEDVKLALEDAGFESYWFEKRYDTPVPWSGNGFRVFIVCTKTK
jgi:SAM-dependent methyltransferase